MRTLNRTQRSRLTPQTTDRAIAVRGFTLLEIVVALVILAILTGLAVPTYNSLLTNAKVSVDTSTAISSASDAVTIAAYKHSPVSEANIATAASETHGVAVAEYSDPSGGPTQVIYTVSQTSPAENVCVNIPDVVNAAPVSCGVYLASEDSGPAPVVTGSMISEIDSPSFYAPGGIYSDGTDVWVANLEGGTYGNGSVSKINIATGAVTEIDSATFNDPYAVATDGVNLWVANYLGDSIDEVNTSTDAISEITSPTFNDPGYIYSNGVNVWVTNFAGGLTGSVSEVNIATRAVTAITNPDIVGVYSADAFDGYIWITNSTGGTYGNGSLSLINMTTGAVTDVNDPRIHSPWAISADSKNVWVADEWGGEYMDGAVLKITP